jgi:nucleoside-diphosphate-sugar epimerase
MGTVVVTGAAGGIGRATCARLEADGYRVIGVDVRTYATPRSAPMSGTRAGAPT